MAAVKTETEDLSARLVDEAGRIFSAEGAAALTLRKLAAATGTSTMAVYTRFGDKQGLFAAMYRAGFERLGATLEAAQDAAAERGDDPLTTLALLGMAYRDAALANPHLYDLMFGRPVPAFEPDPETQAIARSTYLPLVEGVRRCLDAGQLGARDAESIARHLWAVTHGMVGLELAGHLPGDREARDAAYADALVFSVAAFLPPPPEQAVPAPT